MQSIERDHMNTQANTVPTLNHLEWQAVSVALNDAATCGCGGIAKPTVVTRVLRTVFHAKAVQPLADPKLEAVRRFVCETKQRGQSGGMNMSALAEHGYNARQIAALALLSE
jgi:hypothetical protein